MTTPNDGPTVAHLGPKQGKRLTESRGCGRLAYAGRRPHRGLGGILLRRLALSGILRSLAGEAGWCGWSDLNRHGGRPPTDFKSVASTDFATPADRADHTGRDAWDQRPQADLGAGRSRSELAIIRPRSSNRLAIERNRAHNTVHRISLWFGCSPRLLFGSSSRVFHDPLREFDRVCHLARANTCTARTTNMTIGTVKWFNAAKGFGFIQPDDGGNDVFVHISAVERSSLGSLNEGQKVSFELEKDQRSGKMSAGQLQAA